MSDSPLVTKSKEFALEIIKVCNYIKQTKKESVLANQLVRSGTSVGANIREAFYGHVTADFIAKLQIALKECRESEYWLELLIESVYITKSQSDLYIITPLGVHKIKSADMQGFDLISYYISKFEFCGVITKKDPNATAFGIFLAVIYNSSVSFYIGNFNIFKPFSASNTNCERIFALVYNI